LSICTNNNHKSIKKQNFIEFQVLLHNIALCEGKTKKHHHWYGQLEIVHKKVNVTNHDVSAQLKGLLNW